MESYEIRETAAQWRRYQTLATTLAETMEQWRESFVEVQALDLTALLPNLEAFGAELERRLAQVASMLAAELPGRGPQPVELPLAQGSVNQLPHFEQAAITVMRDRLLDLDRATGALFDVVCTIRGHGKIELRPARGKPADTRTVWPDPERLGYTLRYLTILWAAFLALIYVDGLPGGAGLVAMAGGLGIAIATAPQIPIAMLFAPATIGIVCASAIYLFIMPQLSSFAGLGLVIFGTTFLFCYRFSEPRQMLGRAGGSLSSLSLRPSPTSRHTASSLSLLPR